MLYLKANRYYYFLQFIRGIHCFLFKFLSLAIRLSTIKWCISWKQNCILVLGNLCRIQNSQMLLDSKHSRLVLSLENGWVTIHHFKKKAHRFSSNSIIFCDSHFLFSCDLFCYWKTENSKFQRFLSGAYFTPNSRDRRTKKRLFSRSSSTNLWIRLRIL